MFFISFLKALFIIEIFATLLWYFGYVEKWVDEKAMVNFEMYDIRDYKTEIQDT